MKHSGRGEGTDGWLGEDDSPTGTHGFGYGNVGGGGFGNSGRGYGYEGCGAEGGDCYQCPTPPEIAQ